MSFILGAGSKLQLFTGGNYVDVVGVTSIGGPEVTVADVDITVLASPNLFKEFLAGFADGGVVQMEARYEHTQMTVLYAQVRVTNTWRVLFSDNSKWDLTGYINAISTDIPLEEEVSLPFSIKVTGKPTFTQ